MAAGLAVAIDDDHVGVAFGKQGVGERQADGASADGQIIGFQIKHDSLSGVEELPCLNKSADATLVTRSRHASDRPLRGLG